MSPPLRASILGAFRAAVASAEPRSAVAAALSLRGEGLRVGDRWFDLERFDQVVLLGAGKAAEPMARAVEEALGPRLARGLVVTKYGHGAAPGGAGRVEILEAGHPTPDEASLRAGRRLLAEASRLGPRDLLLFVLSGGASALAEVPAPGLSFEDLRRAGEVLLASGASIEDMNAVRKHLSAVKGGQLALRAGGAAVATLVLSDVPVGGLEVVGSGPTAVDPTTWGDVARITRSMPLPAAVRARIELGMRGQIEDTPKPGDPVEGRSLLVEVGSRRVAAEAAAAALRQGGFDVLALPGPLVGEARVAGVMAAMTARAMRPGQALVAAGEATVVVRGAGKGGRNQELALAAAVALDGAGAVALGALATDGQDGPTDAAGAVVDGGTIARARALGFDPLAALDDNDAYPLLDAAGALVRTGPTLTNVNDLLIAVAGPAQGQTSALTWSPVQCSGPGVTFWGSRGVPS